jgi:hypothetical protein
MLFVYYTCNFNFFFHIKHFKMDYISCTFKKNVVKVLILCICIILIEVSSLHVVVPYVF